MADQAVELAVRWAEQGADVPARTAAHLRTLRQVADEAAPSMGDRLGTAFERLERREPTMVLRRTRMELEMLTLQAIGTQGPLARLGAMVPMLFGPWGIAAVGAVAALGGAYKALTADAHDLEEQHKKTAKAVDEFNLKAGGTAALARQTLSGVGGEKPGFFRILAGEFGLGSGGAHVGEGLNERLVRQEQAVRDRTALLRKNFGDAVVPPEAVKQLKDLTAAATETAREIGIVNAALARAHADDVARATGKPTADMARIATMETIRDAGHETERAALTVQLYERGITDLKSPAALDAFERQKEGWKGVGTAAQTAAENAREYTRQLEAVGRLIEGQAVGPGGRPIEGDTGRPAGEASAAFRDPRLHEFGRTGAGAVDWLGRLITQEPNLTDLGRVGVMGAGGGTVGESAAAYDKRRRLKEETDEKLALKIGTVIAGHMVGLASAMSRGDAGGAIASMGSAAGGVMSALSMVKGASPALGPAGALVSSISSAVGGIISLFGTHRPKIIISAFEEQALQEIRNLRADPLTTSYTVIGPADLRSMQYGLSRLQRRDSVTRLP